MPSPEDQLRDMLRVAAEPDTTPRPGADGLLARARRRERLRRTGTPLAAAAAVLLVVAGIAAAVQPTRRAAVAGGPGPQLWTVTTNLLQRDHGPLIACANTEDSNPPHCGGPVVVGVDPADLPLAPEAQAHRDFYPPGTVWTATMRLVGTYEALTNTLTLVEPPRAAARDLLPTPPPQPGCSTPTGRAAAGDEAGRRRLEAYVGEQPDNAGVYLYFNGSAPVVMTAQFTGALPRHAAEIRGLYDGPLCLVQVDVTERALSDTADRTTLALTAIGFAYLDNSTDAIRQNAHITVVAATHEQVRELEARFGPHLQVGSFLTPLQPEAPSSIPPSPVPTPAVTATPAASPNSTPAPNGGCDPGTTPVPQSEPPTTLRTTDPFGKPAIETIHPLTCSTNHTSGGGIRPFGGTPLFDYRLRSPRDIEVTVPVGGGCDKSGTPSISVTEERTRVVLTATVVGRVAYQGDRPCTTQLFVQYLTAHLSESLGDREVVDGYSGRTLSPLG